MTSFRRHLLPALIAITAIPLAASAQTAADYSKYATYTAPRPQGEDPVGTRIFLYGGLKSHGPDAHDYPQFIADWSNLLTAHGAVVDGGLHAPSAADLARTDVAVIYRGDAGFMTPQ